MSTKKTATSGLAWSEDILIKLNCFSQLLKEIALVISPTFPKGRQLLSLKCMHMCVLVPLIPMYANGYLRYVCMCAQA